MGFSVRSPAHSVRFQRQGVEAPIFTSSHGQPTQQVSEPLQGRPLSQLLESHTERKRRLTRDRVLQSRQQRLGVAAAARHPIS